MNASKPHLFTIGHSTRTSDEFIALLKDRGIERVADVRSFPGSRRHPQFGKAALEAALEQAGIHYIHMVSLGGRRGRQEVAMHDTHWRNQAFANYADYTQTPPFRAGLAELEALARSERVAIMCAEALWWRCHRRIIAEELMKDGFAVTHILGAEHDQAARREPELPGL
jgi:uncharacterized protein (DUF488 family)